MSAGWDDRRVSDQRLGASFRAVRIRRGQRQSDTAKFARVSPATVSRIERGHLGPMTVDRIRAVGAALDIRVEIGARWRGGELDRLVNARHSALHEAAARWFTRHGVWSLAPEASFSIYGERGFIDLLAWQANRRALLVIELKSELVDVQELIGSVDRKRRLAASVVHDRGWDPATVSAWVVLADPHQPTPRRRPRASSAGSISGERARPSSVVVESGPACRGAVVPAIQSRHEPSPRSCHASPCAERVHLAERHILTATRPQDEHKSGTHSRSGRLDPARVPPRTV